MHALLDHVAAILTRQSAPALSVTELLRHLKADAPGVPPSPSALLRALEQDPARFTVLRAESGGRSLGRVLGTGDGGGADLDPVGPWVLCATPSDGPYRSPTHTLIRETMAHLGHGLDGRSARAVARWLELLQECDRVGSRLRSYESAA
jgi:hypothetical protein